MKGDKAKEGFICIGENGTVTSYSLKVGNYYVTSSDGINQKITDEKVELDCKKSTVSTPVNQVYEDGKVVYYNPTTGEKCDNYVEANSNTGVKSGCMKWYIFLDNEESSTVKLLLDHNTTAGKAWNSQNKSYIGEVYTSLVADTKDWISEEAPRLITAEEVVDAGQITGWRGSSGQVGYSLPCFGMNLNKKSEYGWLYDRTYSTCDGCFNHAVGPSTRGYWTSTYGRILDGSKHAWMVDYDGYLRHAWIGGQYGVRPVITVSKALIQ